MNLIKHMNITVHGLCGCDDTYRHAVMLKKLLEDAGVPEVVITNKVYSPERQDDELKLFVGAKPDKVTIGISEYFVGG